MKELQRFRQFLTEGKITEDVSPAVINFLQKHTPEEAPGSWDDVNNDFVVPYNYESLAHSEDDVEDYFYFSKGITKADLPTEYIEIDNYPVGDENRPVTARNFAKYVPGKGLYYKMTTELAEEQLKEYGPNVNFRPITQNDWPLEEFGFETTLYDLDSPEGEDVRVMFDTEADFDSDEEAKQWFDRLFDPSSMEIWEEFIETEARELRMDINDLEFDNIRPVTFAFNVNENEEYKNMTFSARTLFDLIARDLKFSPLYQDDTQLSYNDAVQIMDYITQAEESDMGGETALGEYIATGEFK